VNLIGSSPEKLGRYEVRQVIGRGSMGIVYLAKDPAIERIVAIKLIQTTDGMEEDELAVYKERFIREAKAAGQLLHPGVVTLFDFGQSENGIPYLVMEYVSGLTLSEKLRGGPLNIQETIHIAVEVLEALSFAHSRGVVHRDIKPSNILITADHHVKIMDFGIAHLIGSDLTKKDDFLGTPHFMAPEQILRQKVDQKTDLFSFGVVLYQMLTGKRPFTAETLPSMIHAVLQEEPVPPHKVNPQVPTALSQIVLRCLVKDPTKRFQSAQELQKALLEFDLTGTVEMDEEVETVAELQSARNKRRAFWIAGALVLLLLIIVPLLARKSEQQHPPQQAKATNAVVSPKVATSASNEPTTVEQNVVPPAVNTPAKSHAPQKKTAQDSVPAKNEETTSPDTATKSEESEQVAAPDPAPVEIAPFSMTVSHSHVMGSCRGKLTFTATWISFRSTEHNWYWLYPKIHELQRTGEGVLHLETFEKSPLGGNKGYNFTFRPEDLPPDTWARFWRIWMNSK